MILNLVVANVYVEGVGDKLWSYIVELEGKMKKKRLGAVF